MEESSETCHKPENKKKMAVRFGGGGVGGGIFLVGGALAIATLVSGFAIKKRRQKNTTTNNNHQHTPTSPPPKELGKESDKDEVNKGLHLFVPDYSPVVHHHLSNGMAKGVSNIDSNSLISTQNLILDEKPKLEINGKKENPTNGDVIILSNGPKLSESCPLFADSDIDVEEFSENVKKIDDVKEEIEVVKEDASSYADHIAVKDILQTRVNIKEEQGEEERIDGEAVGKKLEEMVEKSHRDQTAADQLQFYEEEETLENVDQEIICLYSSIPQSNHDIKLENVKKNESMEGPMSKEIEEMNGVEAIEAGHEDQSTVEDNPQMQVIEDEEHEGYEHDDDDAEIIAAEASRVDQLEVNDDNNDQHVQWSKESETLTNVDLENFSSNVQEFSFLGLESSCPNPEDAYENVLTESPLSPEAIQVLKVDEAIEADGSSLIAVEFVGQERNIDCDDDDYVDGRENIEDKGEDPSETVHENMDRKVETEDNPKMQSIEEEEEKDEQDIVEKAEESSDGTGNSSVESNSAAIWPAESMKKLSKEIQELKINNQTLEESIGLDRTVNTEDHSPYNRKENNGNGQGIIEDEGKSKTSFSERYMIRLATDKNEATSPSKWWIWLSSMLVPVWCLLCWYFGLSFVKICLIVAFTLMLFKFHEA